MSEIWLPDIVWRCGNATTQGKKLLKIELFSAEQFRCDWNPYSRKRYPHPQLRNREYWQQYYRLRVDGRWFTLNAYKYYFFPPEQAVEIADKMYKRGQ